MLPTKKIPAYAFLPFVSLIIILAYTLKLIIASRFNFPFYDDWWLSEWAAGDAKFSTENLLAHVNGHQLILDKLFSYFLGITTQWNLFILSIVSTLLFALAYGIIVFHYYGESIKKRGGFAFSDALFFSVMAFLVMGLRQMQNYTQVSCFPWPLAILFVCLFAIKWEKFLQEGKHSFWIILSLFLAPMSIGLGLVVPLFVFFRTGLGWLNRRHEGPVRMRRLWTISAWAFVSLLVSEILPIALYKSHVPGLQLSLLDRVKEDPLGLAKFFFASVGSIYVTADYAYMYARRAVILGFLVFMALGTGILLRRQAIKKPTQLFVDTNPLLIMGLFYLVLITLSRWLYLGHNGAIEVRYSSANLLLHFAIWLLAWQLFFKRDRLQKILLVVFILSTAYTWKIGYQSQKDWLSEKLEKTEAVKTCLKRHPVPSGGFTDAHPCLPLIEPTNIFGHEQFMKWLNRSYEKKLSIFSEI